MKCIVARIIRLRVRTCNETIIAKLKKNFILFADDVILKILKKKLFKLPRF